MEYITMGRDFCPGKQVQIYYNPTEDFSSVDILDKCFLISFIMEGACTVNINGKRTLITAPSFVCLNEKDKIELIENRKLEAQSLYFKPSYYSWSLTFETVRVNNSEDLVQRHDCYLFLPFTNRNDSYMGVLPTNPSLKGRIKSLMTSAGQELLIQRDWYWSCRCRSYFTEMLIILERTYNDIKQNVDQYSNNHVVLPEEYKDMDKVLLYIHTNYQNNIRIEDIVRNLNTNRTTLSKRFKEATGYTIIEYLNKYRTQLAESLLTHTNLKVEEISDRLGFGDNAHFSRVFSKYYGLAPQKYREAQRAKE